MDPTDHPPGLIDTDILIDAARKLPAAVAFLSDQRKLSTLRMSVITAMELIVGCRNKDELLKVRQFLASAIVVDISEKASSLALELVNRYWLSQGLLLPDALIAATSIQNQLTLYTKNVRHFQIIPELSVVRPY